MDKENKILDESLNEENNLSFEELDDLLQAQLEDGMEELQALSSEFESIGNPDVLGETIKNVVWEQFINQIAVTAGEDFIEANRGLTLDLRDEAHIQTTENFANGKIASHNTEINYQQRYDDWQSNFQKDPDVEHKTKNYRYNEEQQVWEKHDTRSDSWKKVLNKGAREDFDKGRPTGSNTSRTNMDHTVSAGEIIRDAEANAHMTREEQVAFANSDKNLNLMDSAANQSKGDSTMDEFLNSERDGKKAAERFDIDEEALRKKDKEAREEYDKQKKEGEKKSVEAGKKSQKEEAFRIGGKALRAVVMQLLAELIKEIIRKLILWFKSTGKSLGTLIEKIREAIHAFIGKLKMHMVNATNTLLTTIATAIVGPIVGTIKKVWTLLKQGFKSVKDAVNFLRNPENRNMPIGLKLLEVGKIVMVGASGIGAIVLGEVIEKGLMAVPGFGVEIPLIGSLANVLGIFMGAVVAGIIGAIAIHMIEKATAKERKRMNIEERVDKGNEVLRVQQLIQEREEEKLSDVKRDSVANINERHKQTANYIKDVLNEIDKDNILFTKEAVRQEQKMDTVDFDTLDTMLDDILDE